MNLSIKLCLLAGALGAVSTLASAETPTSAEWARDRVQQGLLSPLIAKENQRSKFSRVVQAPRERRLRILATSLFKDARGRSFMPYAIDVRFGEEWQVDIAGCVYKANDQIYVKRGDQYRPAEFLLGKNVGPVAGVCEGAAPPPPPDRS